MNVLCVSQHPVDLSDGRSIAPGETVDDMDAEDPHNKALLADRHLITLDAQPAAASPPQEEEANS